MQNVYEHENTEVRVQVLIMSLTVTTTNLFCSLTLSFHGLKLSILNYTLHVCNFLHHILLHHRRDMSTLGVRNEYSVLIERWGDSSVK